MSEFIIDRLVSTAHALKESRAYSASVVEEGIAEITRLRQLLSEADKREMEARAKAIEEAALFVENRNGEIPDRQEIAKAIRNMQSEDR